ncbi:MAG: hypothetical protein H6811_09510 [Phycisphaeraceae bacterium]|nr:hypothetical protein [Phycisphaeraceae bacterium]
MESIGREGVRADARRSRWPGADRAAVQRGDTRAVPIGVGGRQAIRDALEELLAGRDRRFEDQLWLGLGDDWTRILDLLIQKEHVERRADDSLGILPAGVRLLEALRGHDLR